MKLYIYRTLCLFFVCFAGAACKKGFLNIVPEGQKVAVTTDDYRQLMADPNMALGIYSGGWQAPAIMADDMAAELTLYNQASFMSQAAFRWEDELFRVEDTDIPVGIWLTHIYQINKVILEVEASSGGSAQLKAEIKAIAQANRAWIYFQLINMYAKPYLASTASSDPGYPIILTADINVNRFERASVQEVYEFIIKDFTEAIPNLPVNPSTGIEFNKSAAHGLLGKVYLYMGRNQDALNAFNTAMAGNASRSKPAVLYDYVKEFSPGGRFLPINFDGPQNSPGNNLYDFTESLVSKRYPFSTNGGNGFTNGYFVLDPRAQSLFKTSDLRLKFFAAKFPGNITNPSGRLLKYAARYCYYGLQLSELYLLSAEAKARLNNLTGAVADVQALRSKRMPAEDVPVPLAVNTDQNALIRYIFDERVREFAMEGYRWFDMRRQSVDPIFSGQVHTHTLYNHALGTSETFTLRPVRLTMRLAGQLINTNPNIVNNP